jgi:CHAT domain-containing protein
MEAAALNNLGALYATAGENRKALEYCEQALPVLRALSDRRGEVSTLINLGALCTSLGEHRKAIEYYNQALPPLRDLGDQRLEATTLNNLGLSCDALGEIRQSLDYYSQALSLWRRSGDRAMEARTLNNLGKTYGYLGEYQQAIGYLNQARAIWRNLDDRQGVGSALQNIGGLYGWLGERQQALDYLGQALLLLREAGDRRGEAVTLSNIGAVYGYLGERREALQHLGQALPLLRAIGDRELEAVTLHNIGAVHSLLNEYQPALDHYLQALPLFQATGNRHGEAMVLTSLGAVYNSLGESQKALDHLARALPLSRAVGDRRGEAHTLSRLARVERDRGNLGEARTQIEAALNIIETLRTRVASQELRAAYFASVQESYELYINLLMRLRQQNPSAGHDVTALQATERARARNLLELLTEAHADIRHGVDPALLEQERSLQQRLNVKVERQIRLLSGKHTPAQAAEVGKEIESLRTQFQEVEAQIRATSPRYAALTQPQPLTLSEIQRQLLDDDTLLLEYALGEERSYLWLVSPNSITSFELPARAVVEDAARRVYDLLTARASKIPDKTAAQGQAIIAQSDKDPAALVELSRIVLGPAAAQLRKKRLVIVSDGALQYIPFAVLPKPVRTSTPGGNGMVSGQPLMLEHEIVSLPSASTLAVMRRELAGRHPAPKIAAVLADPVFESNDPRVKPAAGVEQKPTGDQNSRQDTALKETFIPRALGEAGVVNPGQPIPRLPYSQREAATIRSLVPNGLRKLALGFEASYATATSPELSEYRIVHLATHGLLNSKQPELSGILLSLVDEQGRPQENGLLRLGEIYNLKLPAELVVLSACQTALGKDVKGEGLVGVTRGFMHAGAARVVASLWKVDDAATAELMKRFYEGMLGKRKLRPAEALRQAQMAMRNQKQWRAPYYWAAFVLQGEWR